ncbi:MAG: hypothetical protein KDD82_15355, partial [Planctomycetes bacterium]|nr:hypothetical protein [Planctomycetota bacterium]
VRRYESPAQARAALRGALAQVQATLSRRADVGDLAFGTAGGPLSYVIGTYGNLGFVLRTLHAKQKARGDLAPLVRGLDEALRATVPLDDGAPVPLPRVLGVELPAAAGAVGSATPFQLSFDPAGASAVALAFDCSADASVLQTEEGFELYPARPGPVEVTVRFVTADLRAGSYRFTLEVPAGSTGR